MRRREFIALFGTATVWPFAARAQQRRIGVLLGTAETDPEAQSEIAAFRQEFEQLGWIDGRTARVEYRWTAGSADRMRMSAKELVALQPDAILAITTPAVAALLRETRTVPIVFVRVSDPVGEGFVDDRAKPGGNVTGFINFEASLAGKWLELLKEIAPHITKVAVMFNPKTAPGGGLYFMRIVEAAAPSLAVDVSTAVVHDIAEIERAIAAVARLPNCGLISPPDIFLTVNRELIIDLTKRYRVPAIYQYRYFVKSGGLMSYGIDVIGQHRQAASYVDRILKGAKPADLPVQTPTRFELAVNLRTAKAIGITVPPSLLARADEVIE